MEAQRDLLFLHAVGDQVFLHRQGSAPRKVTIGQAVTAVVGVPIQKDTVDARIGPQVGQDPIQLSAAGWLQRDATTGKRHTGLPHLIEIDRQQLRRADAIFLIGLGKARRQ